MSDLKNAIKAALFAQNGAMAYALSPEFWRSGGAIFSCAINELHLTPEEIETIGTKTWKTLVNLRWDLVY